MIIEFYLVFFFIGILYGILEAWNKKVSFFVWIFCLIYVIFDGGKGFNISATINISNWHWFGLIPALWLGFRLGEFAYEETFKK